MLNMITNGSPNFTGKNVRLLHSPNSDLIFLHCTTHQGYLCKSMLQLDHVGGETSEMKRETEIFLSERLMSLWSCRTQTGCVT